MLTIESAQQAVEFIWDALNDPAAALARTDMGDLHTALTPHLRNYAEDTGATNRQLAFVSAVGSVNYDTVVEHSDLDAKAVYLPAFEDLFYGRFTKFSFVTDRFDCELHPIHHFQKHALKGNMNFFEPFFSKASLVAVPEAALWRSAMKRLIEMNVAETCLATYFTVEQMKKGADPRQWDYRDRKSTKKASHAIRLLVFLINLLETGQFELVPREPFRTMVKSLKTGDVDYVAFVQAYEELHEVVKGKIFKRFEHGGDFDYQDRVLELDRKKSDDWHRELEAADVLIMDAIKHNI